MIYPQLDVEIGLWHNLPLGGYEMVDPPSGGNNVAAPATATGFSGRSIFDLIFSLVRNFKTYIVAGIVSIASYVGWVAWHAADTQIKNYVAAAISEQLKDDKSVVYMSLSSAMNRMRRSEVGSISVGNFVLTHASPSYTLFIYFPENYTGKLYYQFEGNIASNCQRVVLQLPNQPAKPLSADDHSIDLVKVAQSMSKQAEQLNDNDVVEWDEAKKSLRKNLRALTFQLDDRPAQITPVAVQDGGCTSKLQDARLDVSYVTLVAPSIRLAQ